MLTLWSALVESDTKASIQFSSVETAWNSDSVTPTAKGCCTRYGGMRLSAGDGREMCDLGSEPTSGVESLSSYRMWMFRTVICRLLITFLIIPAITDSFLRCSSRTPEH